MNTRDLINATNGKIFSLFYTKKDGTKRKIVARLGVKKGLVGAGRLKPLAANMICVYDMINSGYRTLNVDNVSEFKCGDLK